MFETEKRLPKGRAELTAVIRSAGDIVHIDDAAKTLGIPRNEAAKKLSRWTKQGWLRRVGTGAYVPVSLDALESEHVLDDPWLLVPALFSPCYIGGRTAAEYWDLTEQIFRDVLVMTAQTVREKSQMRHGVEFTLKHIHENKIFGTKSVWRGQTKVAVADIHRTIIDMLDDPATGGGIQHVGDCLDVYLKRQDHDFDTLIEYGDRFGNGAVFKRLGFLAERSATGQALLEPCRKRLTTGNAKLDPALACSRLITKWRLFVPQTWARSGKHD